MPQKRCRRCHVSQSIEEFELLTNPTQGHAHDDVCLTCIEARAKRKHATTLKKRHKLTSQDYEKRLKQQHYQCAICYMPLSRLPRRQGHRRFVVDHDHHTGFTRGLLCNQCNLGLGYFYDNPQFLARAIKYLQASKKAQECSPASAPQQENITAQILLFQGSMLKKLSPQAEKIERIKRSAAAMRKRHKTQKFGT